jgi:hypothetical protein
MEGGTGADTLRGGAGEWLFGLGVDPGVELCRGGGGIIGMVEMARDA